MTSRLQQPPSNNKEQCSSTPLPRHSSVILLFRATSTQEQRAMQLHSISSTSVNGGVSIPSKFLREPNFRPDPPFRCIRSSQRSSEPFSTGLQRQPKKDLSRILRTDSAIKGIEQKAKSSKYHSLWPKAVLEAIDEAIRENNWESALKIFGLMRKQRWYEPRSKMYARLLMMLGKCRQPEEANLLFEVMLSDGLRPTVDVYTALVSAYGQSGQLAQAFSTIDDMKSISDCKPDIYTFSVLINCCIKVRRFEMVKRILDEMSYLGIECNTVTYNTIIYGYGKAGMLDEMENSLTDMIESGSWVPDLFTFNSVIGAYGSTRQVEKMEKWYDEFQLMGITPDVQTFNILLRSYGKSGMHDKMISVLEFMEKRFFSPTVVTYNIIIEAFGKAGVIEKVDKYFRKMKHQGVKPNIITCCSLVSAYSKAGDIVKVDSILRHVENSDVILDTPFFNCIISAYGQAGDVEMMTDLFLEMENRNCTPNYATFATMVQAYKAQGMAEAAQVFENKMITTKEKSGNRFIGA